ncbi:hypothetical protein DFH29DRAFT_884169, partial [Suillus ampliporus]
MDSLQWHAHTFGPSSYDTSDSDSSWDSDSTHSDSYETDLDLRSRNHSSIDSIDLSGPLHPLDAFLESAVTPEDLPDPYKLARTPDDSASIWLDDLKSPCSDPESEYDEEELLILNTPGALYQLFLKEKLQVRINSSKRLRRVVSDLAYTLVLTYGYLDNLHPSAIIGGSGLKTFAHSSWYSLGNVTMKHVNHLVDTAQNPKSHTNYRFLGLAHMQDLAKGYADQTRQLKLQ